MKMPMTEMQIGDQTIRYDRDATVAVYESPEHGDAEECGCIFCKNFTSPGPEFRWTVHWGHFIERMF